MPAVRVIRAMAEGVDRRRLLKAGARAAAGAAMIVVAPALPTEAAELKKVAIGKIAVERLWGSYTTSKTVNGHPTKVKVLRTRSVWSGHDTRTLNRGGMCHWSGTASPLSNGNCVLFGHRTSHGGLLRNLHKVKLNDRVVLEIAGTGSKTYRVVSLPPVISSKDLAIALNWGDTSASYLTLLACSKANRLPTSLKFRLFVRCVEV